MRRFIKLGGLALAMSLLLAGVAAASASAAEIFLTNASYPQNIVTTDNNTLTLNDGGLITLTCSSILGKGTLWGPKVALMLGLIHGCKDNLGNTCQSVGEPNGLIHRLVLSLPVWLNKAQTLPGLLFERHQGNADFSHFKCGLSLVLVRGILLGHISKPAPKVKSHMMELQVLVRNGAQEFEKVEEGVEVFKTETSLNGGTFSPSTLEIIKDIVEFEKAGVEAEFR